MNTIKIGSQEWATEDLKVTKFRNGQDIPLVTDDVEWAKLGTAAYCIAPNGHYLYNWYAVNDERGLAPDGFHVPSDDEWKELFEYLGGEKVAGEKMKTSSWDGSNTSGFSALPGGFRHYSSGHFDFLGSDGYWWSSSSIDSFVWYVSLSFGYTSVVRSLSDYVRDGFSVRCLKTL
jgi:uncharacterized protein (TIGR02145 family)